MTTQTLDAPRGAAAIGWSSRAMFILAAAGSAVGLGNIWKFPYIVGEHGGGAFVLVYLACLALLGLPILIAEIAIGRSGGERPASAFRAVAQTAGRSPRWAWLGDMGAITGLIVLSFYTVVAGWIGLYALDYAAQALGVAAPISRPDAHFEALTQDATAQAAALALTVVAAGALLMGGAVRGVETAMRWMAPLFLGLLGLLAVVAALAAPAPLDVVAYLLSPDFGALTPAAIGEAIGHAFFTLSIGLCGMLVYGAYLPRGADVPKLAFSVALIDTAISMLCAFVVMGLAFAAGADPAQGPGLIFVLLPEAFARMLGGAWLAAAFFATVFMAAFSSVIAVMIVVMRAIEDKFALSAPAAAAACAAAVLASGLVVVASSSGALPISLFGMGLFDLLDTLASSILLPLSGIGVALFAARTLSGEISRYACGALILFCLRWIAPLGLLAVAAAKFA
jgi:neurotransmitter:Na+ symporter, NSS family